MKIASIRQHVFHMTSRKNRALNRRLKIIETSAGKRRDRRENSEE